MGCGVLLGDAVAVVAAVVTAAVVAVTVVAIAIAAVVVAVIAVAVVAIVAAVAALERAVVRPRTRLEFVYVLEERENGSRAFFRGGLLWRLCQSEEEEEWKGGGGGGEAWKFGVAKISWEWNAREQGSAMWML